MAPVSSSVMNAFNSGRDFARAITAETRSALLYLPAQRSDAACAAVRWSRSMADCAWAWLTAQTAMLARKSDIAEERCGTRRMGCLLKSAGQAVHSVEPTIGRSVLSACPHFRGQTQAQRSPGRLRNGASPWTLAPQLLCPEQDIHPCAFAFSAPAPSAATLPCGWRWRDMRY